MLVIGDPAVGKSCLLLRYVDNVFSDTYAGTIGVDFGMKTLEMNGKLIKLNIRDTAGQERFKFITSSSYYRGAHGVIVVFDLTDMRSFHNVKSWLTEVDKYGGENIAKLLVGNKSDLRLKRVVPYESALEFAEKNGMPYVETSAKNSTNVEEAFLTMTEEMIKSYDTGLHQTPAPVVLEKLNPGRNVKSGWCSC